MGSREGGVLSGRSGNQLPFPIHDHCARSACANIHSEEPHMPVLLTCRIGLLNRFSQRRQHITDGLADDSGKELSSD
jgi:hypothetical protein